MNARFSALLGICVIVLFCVLGLAGCGGRRTASLTVDVKNPVAPGKSVTVCYTLPSGTQAAFLAPSLAGAPGFHDVTDTPSACKSVRVTNTTTYKLQIVPDHGAPSTLQAKVTVIPAKRPTAVVTAIEAVPNGGLCPDNIEVRGGIGLLKGGPVSYRVIIDGRPTGAGRRVSIPTEGNLSIAEELPFPAQTSAKAAIEITAPASYISRTLAFRIPCVIAPPAQVAIWKKASAARCQPHSGYVGSGCARTVNKIIAEALGHSVPPGAPPFWCGGIRSAGQPWDPEERHLCQPVWVPDVVQMIEENSQFGKALNRNETIPGDIAVQDGTNAHRGMNHIGFCEDVGCHYVLSNRSSIGELCGHTNATMSDNGYTYPADRQPTFYRVYGVTQAIK